MNLIKEEFLTGDKIYLRAFKEEDLQMISRLENHPDPRETLFYFRPITLNQLKEKYSKLSEDSASILFTICDKENNTAIGQTAFFRIDWVSRASIFYIGIADKENWSKGFGKETLFLMINYAFDTLNLHRIQLHVAVENTTAVKVYQKCGFKIEGTLKDAMFHKGHYSDFYVMGLINEKVI